MNMRTWKMKYSPFNAQKCIIRKHFSSIAFFDARFSTKSMPRSAEACATVLMWRFSACIGTVSKSCRLPSRWCRMHQILRDVVKTGWNLDCKLEFEQRKFGCSELTRVNLSYCGFVRTAVWEPEPRTSRSDLRRRAAGHVTLDWFWWVWEC